VGRGLRVKPAMTERKGHAMTNRMNPSPRIQLGLIEQDGNRSLKKKYILIQLKRQKNETW